MTRAGIAVGVVVVGAIVALGSIALTRSVQLARRPFLEDRHLGSRRRAQVGRALTPSWTPKSQSGYSASATFTGMDAHVPRFADFTVLWPRYLPTGVSVSHCIVSYDPIRKLRILQIALEGSNVGLITEQRIKTPSDQYPEGMLLNTIRENNGSTFRNLQSGDRGTAVSIAVPVTTPDLELVKIREGLRPIKGSHG